MCVYERDIYAREAIARKIRKKKVTMDNVYYTYICVYGEMIQRARVAAPAGGYCRNFSITRYGPGVTATFGGRVSLGFFLSRTPNLL